MDTKINICTNLSSGEKTVTSMVIEDKVVRNDDFNARQFEPKFVQQARETFWNNLSKLGLNVQKPKTDEDWAILCESLREVAANTWKR